MFLEKAVLFLHKTVVRKNQTNILHTIKESPNTITYFFP